MAVVVVIVVVVVVVVVEPGGEVVVVEPPRVVVVLPGGVPGQDAGSEAFLATKRPGWSRRMLLPSKSAQ